MLPLWTALLLAHAPMNAPPTRIDQCAANAPVEQLDAHVQRCGGRLYLDGELAGTGTEADLKRWQDQRAQIAKGTFRSAEGFGKVKWGASEAEVKRAYPKVKAGKSGLELREEVDGLAATVRFAFLEKKLSAVQVQFDPKPQGAGVATAMDDVKKKLVEKLGPSEQGHWDTPATRIDLSFANQGEAVAVRVDYESRELSFLGKPAEPEIAPPDGDTE
jgi:hypothetical protein